MDKVQKIREGIEKLKSNLIHGACSSQVAMETHCKEEAYNEVLAILDTMQEEPASWLDEFRAKLDSLSKEEFEQLWEKYGAEEKEESVSSIWHDASEKSNKPESVVIINPNDYSGDVIPNCIGVNEGNLWACTSDLLNLDNPCKIGKNLQEEPVSEDLIDAAKQYVKEHVIGIDKVTFSIATDMFISGANWQKQKDSIVSEDLEEAAKEYSGKSSHPLNNAFKTGANWQKKRDYIPLSDDINEVARQICNKVLNCEIDYKEGDVVLSDEEECVKAGIRWQMQKESIPSKDLEELINSLSKRYPEISFAKLSRIAVRVSRWQKQQD